VVHPAAARERQASNRPENSRSLPSFIANRFWTSWSVASCTPGGRTFQDAPISIKAGITNTTISLCYRKVKKITFLTNPTYNRIREVLPLARKSQFQTRMSRLRVRDAGGDLTSRCRLVENILPRTFCNGKMKYQRDEYYFDGQYIREKQTYVYTLFEIG
jgi:hypothetical protein